MDQPTLIVVEAPSPSPSRSSNRSDKMVVGIENHVNRQNQARLRRDIERHKFEQLGSLKNTTPIKPRTATPAAPATPKIVEEEKQSSKVVFEILLSNEEKERIRLRSGDDLNGITQALRIKHGLDDLRTAKLRLALEEAMRTASGKDKLEHGWERHWDNKRQRWFAHHRARGESRWL